MGRGRDPAEMWGIDIARWAAAYIVAFFAFLPVADAQNACRGVARAIDQAVAEANDGKAFLRLAPYLGIDGAKKLLARAASGDDDTSFYAYLAVGLSRHAEALRVLRDAPHPKTDGQRLYRALALLALGDGVGTTTISSVLFGGQVQDRRRVAEALAYMPQKRPRQMLYDAIDDADEMVRFYAARAFADLDPIRAKRTLADLLKSGGPGLQKRAAHALVRSGHFFRPEELAQLSTPERIQSIMVDAARQRRSNLRLLGQQFRSNDEAVRASAYASMALLQGAEVVQMKKLEKMAEKKGNADANVELITALALTSDAGAMKTLESFDKAAAKRALLVLWAFQSVGPPKSQLDPTVAGQLARAIEGWVANGFLAEDEASRAIRAMERCDPLAGLLLARARLLQGEGTSLRTAVRLIGRTGSINDLPALLEVAKKANLELKTEVWRAAARVCSR